METIKRLPGSVRSKMRSGVVVFDLTRVVEELVFNSLDSGAKKVSVYVAVGTCYVKVVDDGFGISRDGLVLLGERYVTSKVQHLADMDVVSENFGFRGEALSSIADVSVLDIVTKARGRPNGYRKVMKGSKCLYMGINDDMKDVGTTVVVRDLFYNQPVRRKYIQSSPKKNLHLLKKCVLRIALMHSKVFFKVVDIESEEELLCTRPSSSLSRLTSGFGIEDSSSLHELNISDGVLKLSGYVSGPCFSFAIKVFQYVYINSRFVCKGPIHKLLNHLASMFEYPDPRKAKSVSQKGKKSRHQPSPAYILNLSCPSSLYDLTFEPSKTHAEFKDWDPILVFIEKVILQLWRDTTTDGESSSRTGDKFQKAYTCQGGDSIASVKEDFFDADLSGFAIKRRGVKNHQSSQHLVYSPSKMLIEDVDDLFHREHDKVPSQEFYMNVSEFKEQQADMEFVSDNTYSVQSRNGSLSEYIPMAIKKNDSHLLTSDNNFLLPDDCFLEDKYNTIERSNCHIESRFLSSEWQNESPKIESGVKQESSRSVLSLDHFEVTSELQFRKSNKKPNLQSCSPRRIAPLDRDLFASKEGFEFPNDGFKNKRRRVCMDENVSIPKGDQRLDFFPGALQQDAASCSQQLPAHFVGEMFAAFGRPSGTSAKSFASNGKPFVEEKGLAFDSFPQMETYDPGGHSSKSEWCSVTSDALIQQRGWDVEHFLGDNAAEEGVRWDKRADHWHFSDGCDIMSKHSSQENFLSSCTSTVVDFKDLIDSDEDISKFLQQHNQHNKFFLQNSDISVSDIDWPLMDPGFEGTKRNDKYWEQFRVFKERSRRSNSAPPFYRQKRKFVSLNNHSTRKEECHTQLFPDELTSPEANNLEHLSFQPNYAEDLTLSTRSKAKNVSDIMPSMEIQTGNLEHSQHPEASSVEGFMSKDAQESIDYGTKWRNGCQQIANRNKPSNIESQHNILDISSGFLHLAGNSLVPESIHKNCLEDARVLQQVDKKFIPIVAGGTLAVIDQHAADERIRLEELRQKVLSGEAKTVTHLDAEQELILPEMGYQLLISYAEEVREWGWICNIQDQGSGTFKKNLNVLHQQRTVITLLAVPCIFGVNLSDGDLSEFLQQLADTDGSSTMPPSVLRILNYKACRGAIMFGDSLLPSECSLIVEELKQTSLCFQCAHGRPTTAPLVNMEALHKQLEKLGVSDNDSWHGLRRQEISFERTAQRLTAARDC